ncbi:MAG: HAMP domain-containing histidine kinase, partial [Acetobacteraceae bacterium]|nr:HAMP domain-containing histidine kinase [Acetobacteraceae bacterium]
TPPAAGLAAALAALLLGFLAARSLESRLQAASASARAIMDGDLARRLPVTGRGDEFDRLAVTVNALLARIEALMRAQRQVTDDIAHDLRSPLSRLRQSLEGALARPRDAEADAATLEAALAELDQVLGSFSALLRIARAESGALRAGFEPVDLSALARAAAELYAPLAEEQGRTLVADIAPGVTLPGDAALLRQAVANLIENALTHGAGRIGLTLTPDRALAVSDEGPGIPTEAREAVTRRFHRLDRSRSTPGTGLGLALVAAAAQAHGGRLELSGERGLVATLRL